MAPHRANTTSWETIALFSWFAAPVRAFTRYVGEPNDPNMYPISQQCGGYNQTTFQEGLCPRLLRCVLDNIPSEIAAGLSSGSNIASLVPTITALIGAPPLDLVQMALLSPHRALATCCFSIGLPSGLFRQLKPLLPRLGDRIEHEPRVREWVFQLPTASSEKWQYGWRNTVIRLLVDATMLALAGIMLWYSWKINTEVMITWRCEYSILVFMWPIACMSWMVLAMLLLWAGKEKMEVLYCHGGPNSDATKLSLLQFIMLPYRLNAPEASQTADVQLLPQTEPENKPDSPTLPRVQGVSASSTLVHRAETWPRSPDLTKTSTIHSLSKDTSAKAPTVIIRIIMPHDFGIRSWRWYEAFLEALAVGIYLYATFVLTSATFMSGEMALAFASVVTLCLSGVRILGMLF